MDARAPDALSHCTDMTPKKRREWARFFLDARRQGFGGPSLLLFSIACASDAGSVVPILLAVRATWRISLARSPVRRTRPTWHLPPTWAPRFLAVIALVVVAWGLSLGDGRAPRARTYVDAREPEVREWLLTNQEDAGVVAKKMPSTRMKGQLAPPCGTAPVQVVINDGCWGEMASPPPCGDLYEHEGRCYIPVAEKKRPPTSLDE